MCSLAKRFVTNSLSASYNSFFNALNEYTYRSSLTGLHNTPSELRGGRNQGYSSGLQVKVESAAVGGELDDLYT